MKLTKSEVLHFTPDSYATVATIQGVILRAYGVGVDDKVASRIIQDYKAQHETKTRT